jgi:NAD(P)-dependent dehydrogenase (short-subunit alcohol dehydrogenase family)
MEGKTRANCVARGPVWTPLNIADKPVEKAAEHGKETPMERPAQPEEVCPHLFSLYPRGLQLYQGSSVDFALWRN